jgi:hypothetical protein
MHALPGLNHTAIIFTYRSILTNILVCGAPRPLPPPSPARLVSDAAYGRSCSRRSAGYSPPDTLTTLYNPHLSPYNPPLSVAFFFASNRHLKRKLTFAFTGNSVRPECSDAGP